MEIKIYSIQTINQLTLIKSRSRRDKKLHTAEKYIALNIHIICIRATSPANVTHTPTLFQREILHARAASTFLTMFLNFR